MSTYDPEPPIASMNYWIAEADKIGDAALYIAPGGATVSQGWRTVTPGPLNTGARQSFGDSPPRYWWPIVSQLPTSAAWMWYDSGRDLSPGFPFVGFNHDEFLIFRLPLTALWLTQAGNGIPAGGHPDLVQLGLTYQVPPPHTP